MENKKTDNVHTLSAGKVEEDLDEHQYLPSSIPKNDSIANSFRNAVSPTLWDNNPWTLPRPSMIPASSSTPSLNSQSSSPERLYSRDFVEHADLVEVGNSRARKPLGPRQSKVMSDLAFRRRVEVATESLKLVDRSSLELNNTARDHPLYHNVTPKADGLYHCPFEDDPKTNCTHKPEKLKCNYDKFVDSHLKPYKCKVNTCKDLSFSSTACLLRHERVAHAMHGHGDKPFLCTYEGCERGVPGNGFPRHWNLRDHMKRVHNDPGVAKDRGSNSSGHQSAPLIKGKKRKAGDSPLSWEKSSEGIPAQPWVPEQESSLIDRYREKQQSLLEIVAKLQDPRNPDNMVLLREANDCINVMVQISQRIKSAPAMQSRTDLDIG